MKILRNMLLCLLLVAIMTVVTILIQGAKGKLSPETMEKVSKIPYLVWNDAWGNARGFTWRVTWRMIKEFTFVKLLIGVGPDGYARYGYEFYQDLIRVGWQQEVLTNAHNEWVNMIVDFGILGAFTYLGGYISQLVRNVKKCDHAYWLAGISARIASYLFHNIFCYQQVLCTPFLFLLMGIGERIIRQQND